MARAFVRQPLVLLLDEPSSALDSLTEVALQVRGRRGGVWASTCLQLACLDACSGPARCPQLSRVQLIQVCGGVEQEAIHGVTRRCTTLIITHRLRTATDAHRVVCLDEGRAVEMGTFQELLVS